MLDPAGEVMNFTSFSGTGIVEGSQPTVSSVASAAPCRREETRQSEGLDEVGQNTCTSADLQIARSVTNYYRYTTCTRVSQSARGVRSAMTLLVAS